MIYQTDETRERILTMAQRLFIEKGLFATRMQDVARGLGISRTSLYRYYQDKSELATAILGKLFEEKNRVWARVLADSPPRATGLAEVEFFLTGYWLSERFALIHAYMAEYDAFFSGVRLDDRVRAGIEQTVKVDPISAMQDLVGRGMADGSIRGDLEPHLAAVTLVNAVRSLQQRLFLRGRGLVEVHSGELPRMGPEHLRYLMAGIAAKP